MCRLLYQFAKETDQQQTQTVFPYVYLYSIHDPLTSANGFSMDNKTKWLQSDASCVYINGDRP